jgi:hypothetical protein
LERYLNSEAGRVEYLSRRVMGERVEELKGSLGSETHCLICESEEDWKAVER